MAAVDVFRALAERNGSEIVDHGRGRYHHCTKISPILFARDSSAETDELCTGTRSLFSADTPTIHDVGSGNAVAITVLSLKHTTRHIHAYRHTRSVSIVRFFGLCFSFSTCACVGVIAVSTADVGSGRILARRLGFLSTHSLDPNMLASVSLKAN